MQVYKPFFSNSYAICSLKLQHSSNMMHIFKHNNIKYLNKKFWSVWEYKLVATHRDKNTCSAK